MLFTSFEFIAFVMAALVLYYIVPKKVQWIVLLAANAWFYVQAGYAGLIYILATIITTYCSALGIEALQKRQKQYLTDNKETLSKEDKKIYKQHSKSRQKLWLVACLLINFGILAVLKYTNFVILNFTSFSAVNFILPMGISFYTFQSMGYLMDVYRGSSRPERNVAKYALFISFFPQLVQGPINRWNNLSKTLYAEHSLDWNNITLGFQRILWGYFKKLVIADRAAIGLATVISDTGVYNGAFALVGMLLYGIDLYADFTSGMDITIGIGQMFGITLAENFNKPFFSANIAEYWKRWHITLCSWFKDYVFYPISMSHWMNSLTKKLKKSVGHGVASRVPVYTASIIVWFITGLWHGASWNFIVWGLINCFVLLASQELEPLYHKVNDKVGYRNIKGYKVFEILRTTLLVFAINMLDYYIDIGTAFKMFGSMFTTANYGYVFTKGIFELGITASDYIVIIAGVLIIYVVSLLDVKKNVRQRLVDRPYAVRAAAYIILFLLIVVFGTYGIGYESSQFIYNQF